MRTCSNVPVNSSKDKDSESVNLKEQATKIEQVIEDNKHKIEPKASDISDEECKYDYMYIWLINNLAIQRIFLVLFTFINLYEP